MQKRAQTRRRMPRRTVQLPSSIDAAPGMIRDVSPWGAFFSPRERIEHQTDDVVQLSLGDCTTVLAKVRWSGWSSKHGCAGLGLEYVATLGNPEQLQE